MTAAIIIITLTMTNLYYLQLSMMSQQAICNYYNFGSYNRYDITILTITTANIMAKTMVVAKLQRL